MSQQRVLTQSKETLLQSYNKRLKDDVKSIMDNFTEIIKSAKIEEETQVSRATQGEQDNYEMHVRAANIVRAGESLMKLVSDLKQFLILNDFPSVNEAINQRNQQLRALQEECDKKLIALRDEISIDLYELEEEYYSSSLRERGIGGLASGKPHHFPGCCRQRDGAESSRPAGLGAFTPSHQRAWGGRPRALLKRDRSPLRAGAAFQQ
ncbi:mediator of RNA polymerase II transcription subunit 22 isoform X1 [Thamnophis elegans]|uniref:mediator of RNA polymerase II transcription subunit 22 isoform X1 n=1 Tax=Thamnophis elegans TaxID=35005 RepID=UPI001378BA04|nr:mediator of RNA polymerase II transcription subunit 22 isoform X1 [Thamnophis elegans]